MKGLSKLQAKAAGQSSTGAFVIVLAAGFMTLLDVSIVNVALPSIESSLQAGPSQVQWAIAGYALTFGLSLVAAGRAGDIFGRRLLFIIGLAGFVIASAGCGFAPTAEWLIIMRLLQGLFAGVLNPQVLGLIQDLFQGPARAKAFGVFGVVVGVSTAIGPALGGAIIALAGPELGWRLVFLINIPIGAVVLPLAAKWLPAPPIRVKTGFRAWLRQFDAVGIILLGIIVLAVMWPFLASSGETGPSSSGASAPYWMLGVAAALAFLLVAWERFLHSRGNQVLLDPALVHNPSFVLGVATAFFYFAGFTSIFITSTLYLQQGMGWSPLQAGLGIVPFALVSGAASGASGFLVNRFGRTVPVVGAAIVSVSMIGVAAAAAWVEMPQQPFVVLGALTVAGIGSGLVISPNQALTLDGVERNLAGIAAALLQTFQRLGTAIGLSIVTTIYFVSLSAPGGSATIGERHSHGIALSALAIAGILFFSFLSTLVDSLRRKKTMIAELHETIAIDEVKAEMNKPKETSDGSDIPESSLDDSSGEGKKPSGEELEE